MASTSGPEPLVGRTALDAHGDKIGKVGQVYLDDQSGQPTWVTIGSGLFGKQENFAPLYGATLNGEDVILSVTKGHVKDAPDVADEEHLNENEQRALYDYYSQILGVGWKQAGQRGSDRNAAQSTREDATGHDTSGSTTDDAMTRSEEQLRVGTEQVETGRARLRKYVVTENVTQTVPVSHEEIRVEREPVTDANAGAATEGPAISEDEHEVTLHAERPVVEKQTVPVERVRLDTETVTDQQNVEEPVRKEQIELDSDDGSAEASERR